MKLRVLLADDHAVVRQGLRVLLESSGFEVVGEASNGREAVDMARTLAPSVAVLDLSMPVLNGLDAAREILRLVPGTPVVLLTMHAGDRYVVEALRSGVTGYVLKGRSIASLIEAIEETSKGRIYLSPSVSRSVVDAYLAKSGARTGALTPRERQILQLVAEGKTTREAAGILGVSVKTAESHRTRLMEKLDIHETAGLVRYAIREGIIEA